jgi:hypothetical protein
MANKYVLAVHSVSSRSSRRGETDVLSTSSRRAERVALGSGLSNDGRYSVERHSHMARPVRSDRVSCWYRRLGLPSFDDDLNDIRETQKHECERALRVYHYLASMSSGLSNGPLLNL